MNKVKKTDYLNFFRESLAPYEGDFPNRIINYCYAPAQSKFTGALSPGTLGRWAYFESSMYRFTREEAYLNRARVLLTHLIEGIQKTPKKLWHIWKYKTLEDQKILMAAYKKNSGQMTYLEGFAVPLPIASICKDLEAVNGWESSRQRESAKNALAKIVDHGISPSNHYTPTNIRTVNKSSTRARGMLMASQVFPDHPHAETWRRWAEQVASYNLNRPSWEDVLNYQSDWFHSIIHLIELLDMGEEVYFTPYHRAYFEHFKEMVTPAGMGIGYGDGGDAPSGVLPILEKGATVFRDGVYKYLAAQHFKMYAPQLLDYSEDKRDIHAVLWRWIDAYRWADDSIEPIPSAIRSTVTCERKVILKSGESMLALTSDEGRFHGHFDANAIAKLVHGGSMLLTDGGYQWPEAVNHNRLLWREGTPEDTVLDHFRPLKTKPYKIIDEKGEGKVVFSQPGPSKGVEPSWHPASDKFIKVEFLADFPEFSCVRTRLGPHTRTVVLDSQGGCLIFDYLKTEVPTTAANIYYVNKVVEKGKNWVQGRIDRDQPHDLLTVFLEPDKANIEEQVRDINMKPFKTQKAVYGYRQGSFPDGLWLVAALYPLKRQANPLEILTRLKHQSTEASKVVTFDNGENVTYCCRQKRRMMDLPHNIQTDAQVARLQETEEGLQIAIVKGTTLRCKGWKILVLPAPMNSQTIIKSSNR